MDLSSHQALFQANSDEICRRFNKTITLPSVLLSCVWFLHRLLQLSLFLPDSSVNSICLLLPPAILKKSLVPSSTQLENLLMVHMVEHNPTTQHCCLSILEMLTIWQLIDAQINSLALLFFSNCFWTIRRFCDPLVCAGNSGWFSMAGMYKKCFWVEKTNHLADTCPAR